MRMIPFNMNREVVEKTVRLLNGPAMLSLKWQLEPYGAWTSFNNKEKATILRGFLLRLFEEWLRCDRTLLPKGFSVYARGSSWPGGEVEWNVSLGPKLGQRTTEMEFTAAKATPAFTSWLWRSYWDWSQRVYRHTWFTEDGFIFTYFQASPSEGPPRELPPDLRLDEKTSEQWDEALLWFAYLLNSGHSALLERCSYCRRFYARERTPKGAREGGSACPTCLNAGAKARTQSSRSRHKETLLALVARASSEWQPSNRHPDKTAFVLGRLNAELARQRKDPKGKRWLTQNRNAIESRQKELTNDAKG